MKNQKVMTPEKVEEIAEQLFVTPTEKKKPVLKNIKLEKLRPFKDHPYKVQDTAKRTGYETIASLRMTVSPARPLNAPVFRKWRK